MKKDKMLEEIEEILAERYVKNLQAVAGWAILVLEKHGNALSGKLRADGKRLLAETKLSKALYDEIVED